MSGYPPVQKESWQERSIRARQQYAARNNPLNAPLMARPPMATSGRYFIWYGWKDRKTSKYPTFTAKIQVLQCSHIFKNGDRCKKDVCLGSDLCVDHLQMVGINTLAKYKYGATSRVVDTIQRVYVNCEYEKDELVLRLYHEVLSLEEHLRRYQLDNRTGPHEFGFEYNGKYRFLDFVQYDNEAMYLKISTDEDRANLYFDLNNTHFEPGSSDAIELKATRKIERYEQLVINPIANHDYSFLRQATPDTALYVENFFYRGVPGKYRNRDIIDILNKPNIHGFWRGKGKGKKLIDPYAPGRGVQPNSDDENDNGNVDGNDDGNDNDNGGDGDGGDDGDDGGNPNFTDGNTSNTNLAQAPINQNYYQPNYNAKYNAIQRLGLTNFYNNYDANINNIYNEILNEIANESIKDVRDDTAWAAQHNAEVHKDQRQRQKKLIWE